jgi:hypothetical protein
VCAESSAACAASSDSPQKSTSQAPRGSASGASRKRGRSNPTSLRELLGDPDAIDEFINTASGALLTQIFSDAKVPLGAGTVDERRDRARQFIGHARNAADRLNLIRKWLLDKHTKKVDGEPCLISEDYHDEFNLIDVIDHYLAFIKYPFKIYSWHAVVLAGLLGLAVYNAWCIMKEESSYRRPTAEGLLRVHPSYRHDTKNQVRRFETAFKGFVREVLEGWAETLNPAHTVNRFQ